MVLSIRSRLVVVVVAYAPCVAAAQGVNPSTPLPTLDMSGGCIAQGTCLSADNVSLADENAQIRGKAISALGWIGPQAETALVPLAKLEGDADPKVRERVARAVHRIRTGALE